MALIITSEIPTSAGTTNQAFLIIEKTSYAIDQSALRYGIDSLSVDTRLYLNKESWESNPKSSCISNSLSSSFSFQGGTSPDILLPLKDNTPLLEACYDLIKAELEASGLTVEYGTDTNVELLETMRNWREGHKEDMRKAEEAQRAELEKLQQEILEAQLAAALKLAEEQAAADAAADEKAKADAAAEADAAADAAAEEAAEEAAREQARLLAEVKKFNVEVAELVNVIKNSFDKTIQYDILKDQTEVDKLSGIESITENILDAASDRTNKVSNEGESAISSNLSQMKALSAQVLESIGNLIYKDDIPAEYVTWKEESIGTATQLNQIISAELSKYNAA